MTSPQDFTRLCNAILAAEHGDDFLPIDDDRPDRGNDGYLKSEKRIFAGHCFKRVQNQSIDQFIRNKMIGDLGKAATLKEQGLWEVDSWTFLSNYPIPEEIGQRINELGAKSGIDASWRGPSQLAEEFQRHEHLFEQFPLLNVTQIGNQLTDIQETFGDQLSEIQETLDELIVTNPSDHSDGSQSHGSDESDASEPASVLPLTSEQQRRMVSEKPPGWEYLLYAGLLKQRKDALESKWEDELLGASRGERRRISEDEASDFLSDQFGVARSITRDLEVPFSAEGQERAFGKPGEAGDPERIENLARHMMRGYEELLDWAASMRAVVPPDQFEKLYEIAARFVRSPAETLREFVEEFATRIETLPAKIAAREPVHIEMDVVFEVDPAVSDELSAEMKRVYT